MITRVSIFKKELKNLSETTHLGAMYSLLFAIKSDEELDELLEYTHSRFDKDKEWWFYEWHKSVRQCDYFNRCYKLVDERTPKQLKETDELNKELEKLHKKFVFELKRLPDGEEYSEEDYKKHEDSYKTMWENPEYKKVLAKKHKLLRIRDTKKSIGGNLDGLLWNLVHLDEKNEIKKLFEKTFALYTIDNSEGVFNTIDS